jgi:predicted ATPase/transcriptional regulator with XRE-family HTH domain
MPLRHKSAARAEDAARQAEKQAWTMEDRGREAVSVGFGTLLRQYRLAAGLSQETLAERARLSLHGISALERGYRRTPQRETLELLAGALALNPEQRRTFEQAARQTSFRRGRGGDRVTVGPWPSPGSAHLPLALTRFVGRQSEREEIAALLRDHRLVTITGAGGVGKTQTALRAATALNGASNAAVCFVGVASINDPSLVASAIANALGVQEVPNHALLDTLVAFLRNKSVLLVLDNCEHVIEQAAIASEALLSACPGLRILTTSREPLKTAGERAYRLPSLSQDDSVALFVDRAQAADAHFQLSGENRLPIIEITRRLGGIPLAIELAAARVNVLPPAAIADGLNVCFQTLGGGERTALPRQQTMRAAIDWSYGLISSSEQRVFERLSIFSSGCTFETAVSVCTDKEVVADDVFRLVSALVEKSLVVADLGGVVPRYRLLEPFRQYAREKLRAHGEDRRVASRHALSLLEVARQLDAQYDTAPEPEWLELVRAEADDWRAALTWALADRVDVLTGQRTVGALAKRADCFSPGEWRRWIDLALSLEGPHTTTETRAGLRHAQCVLSQTLGRHELELAFALEALALYQAVKDGLRVVLCKTHAARVLFLMDRDSEAEPLAREAVALGRPLELRKHLAFALRVLSMGCCHRQDFQAARRCIAEARAIDMAAGGVTTVQFNTMELASCELAAGNPKAATIYMSEAAAHYRAIGNARLLSGALGFLARCCALSGEEDRAQAYARESLALCIERQIVVGIAMNIQTLVALALLGRREVKASNRLLERCARLLGFVDVCLVSNGSPRYPNETEEYERELRVIRDQLSEEAIEFFMSEGAAMSEERAVEDARSL